MRATDDQLRERLCVYDARNPISADLQDADEPTPAARDDCACDNCFYGRHALADELLQLRALMQRRRENPRDRQQSLI